MGKQLTATELSDLALQLRDIRIKLDGEMNTEAEELSNIIYSVEDRAGMRALRELRERAEAQAEAEAETGAARQGKQEIRGPAGGYKIVIDGAAEPVNAFGLTERQMELRENMAAHR